jgi:flagellar protein FliS
MTMRAKDALSEYARHMTQHETTDADPHKLIQMLLSGALKNISLAKNTIKENKQLSVKDIASKGSWTSAAISIIECLRASLNKEKGGKIAENLDMLYDYMRWRLVAANLNNDIEIYDEVSALLTDIKVSWDTIREPSLKYINETNHGKEN